MGPAGPGPQYFAKHYEKDDNFVIDTLPIASTLRGTLCPLTQTVRASVLFFKENITNDLQISSYQNVQIARVSGASLLDLHQGLCLFKETIKRYPLNSYPTKGFAFLKKLLKNNL